MDATPPWGRAQEAPAAALRPPARTFPRLWSWQVLDDLLDYAGAQGRRNASFKDYPGSYLAAAHPLRLADASGASSVPPQHGD